MAIPQNPKITTTDLEKIRQNEIALQYLTTGANNLEFDLTLFNNTQQKVNQLLNETREKKIAAGLDPDLNIFSQSGLGSVIDINAAKKFAASPSSAVANGTGTEQKNDVVALSFKENPFTQYSNLTYHFHFFMSDLQSANAKSPDEIKNKLTICESGVNNEYTIKDVEIESYVAPGFKNRNMHLLYNINFTVSEPKGFSLYDGIIGASKRLGILNYRTCPYFLELSFMGYDENGVPTGKLPEYTKVWPIVIVEMESNITADGTEYRFKTVAFDNLAGRDQAAVLAESRTFSGATIGEILEQLESAFNQIAKFGLGNRRIVPDEYVIDVDPEIASYTIKPPSDANNPKTKEPNIIIGSSKEVIMRAGSDIGSLIDVLMTSTENSLKELKRGEDINTIDQDDTKVFSKLWVILQDVEIIGYDRFSKDYARRYYYNIVKYDTVKGVIDPLYPDNQNAANQTARWTTFGSGDDRIIHKRYEYLYTGENTEVISTDINLNMLWHVALPFIMSNRVTQGNQGDTVISDLNVKQQQLLELQKQADQLKVDLEREKINPSSSTLGISNAVEQRVEDLRTIENQIGDLRGQIQSLDPGAIPTSSGLDRFLAPGTVTPASKFVSDQVSLSLAATTLFDKNSTELPMTFLVDVRKVEANFRTMVEPKEDRSRSIASAVLNQIYVQSQSDLFQIEMNIKGDPWWFGTTIFEHRSSPQVNKNAGAEFANFRYKDNLILFEFRTPRVEDENTGIISFQRSDLYSGVYQVHKILHNFSNGMFTQQLSCFREPVTNIKFAPKIQK